VSRGAKGDETMTKALARFLAQRLVPDLKERARTPSVAEALRHRWEHERDTRRTADLYDPWAARLVEQVGAAWILSCAFVRTLEDRGYLAQRRLAGPGAADSEHYFFELFPQLGARDYLLAVFREMGHLPGAADLFGPDHNAAWRLAPSNPVAQELLALWRSTTEERAPTWTFEGTDTRFLGDLYQWLSEDARERFALLQTPDFVEEFILGLTLDPAIEEFGLETVRLIDPTCGSGHFLLGAFDRLFERRAAAKPGLDRRAHALSALAQVHGVDINPYAVEIARFRLTLSFLEKAGIERIADAPALKTNLVVADSLLHGAASGNLRLSDLAQDKRDWGDAQFTLDDEPEARRILGQGYHAVVGNPPYITCKDAVLRELYRELYPKSAAGKFALAAPFTERFFQLGVDGGFIGLINANSFMKREFGKKLIEEVLPRVDLTHVLDTAGAYIPGHGTPTVVMVGRNRRPRSETVCAVMGKRGEPDTPIDPANGVVWTSIAGHVSDVGFENDFVSVADVQRVTLSRHPWSLGGGGAADLKSVLESRASHTLADVTLSIGPMAVTGEDDAFVADAPLFRRLGLPFRGFGIGEVVRDWAIADTSAVLFPYRDDWNAHLDPKQERFLWPYRRSLSRRLMFGKTQLEAGLQWWEYRHLGRDKIRTRLSIAFAFVSTHNQFALDRGAKVFNRTAPVIKMRDGATEAEHLSLLGYLNSSTACFLMKQVLFQKSSQNYVGDVKDKPERIHYEFSGTALAKVPVFAGDALAVAVAEKLDELAQELARLAPNAVLRDRRRVGPLSDLLAGAARLSTHIRRRMVVLQEELDWLVYVAAKLAPRELALSCIEDIGESVADASERPFCGGRECAFDGLSPNLRELWARRQMSLRAAECDCSAVEQPMFKRPWLGTQGVFHRDAWTYQELSKPALEAALMERIEEIVSTGVATVRAVADALAREPRTVEVIQLLAGTSSPDVQAVLQPIVAGEAIPFLGSMRLTTFGLEKRAAWERTWDLQRLEDAGKLNGQTIPLPPKYDSKDYANANFWRLRGKLDVPKERFISYPGAARDDDKSPLIGWAGWDHLQRAQALAALYEERKTQDGWPKERLVPLLAGILELVPWLIQWHNEPNADFGDAKLGEYFDGYVTSEASALGVTLDELRAWNPEPAKGRRGRKPATKAKETP
jgi:hypothetical protein